MKFLALLVTSILALPLFSQVENLELYQYIFPETEPAIMYRDSFEYMTETLDTIPHVLLTCDTSVQEDWPIYLVVPDSAGLTSDTLSMFYMKHYDPTASWEFGYAVYERKSLGGFNIVYDSNGERILYYQEFKCYLDKDKNPFPPTKLVWMSITR